MDSTDLKFHKENIVKELSRSELEQRYIELYEKYQDLKEFFDWVDENIRENRKGSYKYKYYCWQIFHTMSEVYEFWKTNIKTTGITSRERRKGNEQNSL